MWVATRPKACAINFFRRHRLTERIWVEDKLLIDVERRERIYLQQKLLTIFFDPTTAERVARARATVRMGPT